MKSREITVPSVAPGEHLAASGGGCFIHVKGDVGEGAILTAEGGSAEIIVDGYVHAQASLAVQGGCSKIVIKGGKHSTVRTKAKGGDAQVIVRGTRLPRPPRPPTPPRPPAWPKMFDTDMWHSSSSSSVSVSNVNGGSIKITDEGVWIDGVKYSHDSPAQKKYSPTPPKSNAKVLQVQKSHRPREQWGT